MSLLRIILPCALLVFSPACSTVSTQVEVTSIALDAYFARESQEGRFSGAVLVARGDTVLLENGYGFSDFELATPMRADSILRIGSLTKPITASAVLVAVQSGRISLDDSACAAISQCPSSWRAVKVRHLLGHASGIEDHFSDLEARPVTETVDELQRVVASLDPDEPLESIPGERYSYSNFNYILLGAILERAYNAPWERVLHDAVLAPSEAVDIAYDDVWALVPRRAHGYARAEDGSLRNVELDDHAAYAAGGLRATTRDLFLWSRALFGGRLVREPLLREMITPVRGQYGFGWQVRRFLGRQVQNHNGGIDGFSSHIAHYSDEDVTIIILSNIETDAPILAACDAAALLFGVRSIRDAPWPSLTPRERCAVE